MNINRNQFNQINGRWGNQLGGMHNWRTRYPARMNFWNGWGNHVRHGWWGFHHHPGWFGSGWWGQHRYPWCGWHYGFSFNRRPWGYWWTYPTFAACTNWFTWSAPATVWSEPVFYDYGQGGNVVYENNNVYINGQEIASADEFAQSEMSLATVEPPPSEEAAEEAEWLSLGTFAVSSNEKEAEPNRVIQLAVDKQGVISGTLFNTETDQSQSVQGQVDKDTQRVAFRIGDNENVVIETGLYNLTQDEGAGPGPLWRREDRELAVCTNGKPGSGRRGRGFGRRRRDRRAERSNDFSAIRTLEASGSLNGSPCFTCDAELHGDKPRGSLMYQRTCLKAHSGFAPGTGAFTLACHS